MDLDTRKIDDAVLALRYQQGYVTDPHGKAKSVVFAEEGSEQAERLVSELFGKEGRTGRSS